MNEELQRRILALEEQLSELASTVQKESQINHEQAQAIARHINSVSRTQKKSDLPMVFMLGTFLTFMVALASLEIGAEGVSFSPRETITTLIAVPGLVGAIATVALPAIQALLRKYNLDSGNIVSLPVETPRSISD